MSTVNVEMVINLRCELAEGPVWDEQAQRLYWVNILAGQLQRTDPVTGATETFEVGKPVGAAVLRASEGLVLATESGFAYFDPEDNETMLIVDPEAEKPENRFNDGKCDPAGRFWAGTMAYSQQEGAGALYCLGSDEKVTKVVRNVTISNGLAWSGDDRTMYHIDTPARKVYAFDYDRPTGNVSNQRVVIDIAPELGYPDGMTIDTDDNLWIAHNSGGCVRCWNPGTAEVLETIYIPTPQVTSCTFGGSELDALFVTTAWEHMSEQQKQQESLAGALFAVKLPQQGKPANRFAG